MKPLLPTFCRPLGYLILFLSLFIIPALYMQGLVTDHNLLFYKECTKLLMMAGCLFILFALRKHESMETERIRSLAARNAIFVTFFFIVGGVVWRVMHGDLVTVDTSSFLTYLVIHVLCLEFGIQRAVVNRLFKR